MSLISINKVSKTFGNGHTAIKAVQDVSFNVEPGDIILIMGPSGSGKTTLLSMIGTLMKPTAGEIIIDGQDIAELSASRVASFRLHTLSFVFQSFNLLAAISAEQNVMIPLLADRTSKIQARVQADAVLSKLGMAQRLEHLPSKLSGGEKQRVAVARALVNNPKVILADEPTANLDSKTGTEVMSLLCSIACNEGKAIIIVSHDPRLKETVKRVITIEDGKLTSEEKGNHDSSCPHHNRKLR